MSPFGHSMSRAQPVARHQQTMPAQKKENDYFNGKNVFNSFGVTNRINKYLPQEQVVEMYKKPIYLEDEPISLYQNDFLAKDYGTLDD